VFLRDLGEFAAFLKIYILLKVTLGSVTVSLVLSKLAVFYTQIFFENLPFWRLLKD
jgi:hypothetical protein